MSQCSPSSSIDLYGLAGPGSGVRERAGPRGSGGLDREPRRRGATGQAGGAPPGPGRAGIVEAEIATLTQAHSTPGSLAYQGIERLEEAVSPQNCQRLWRWGWDSNPRCTCAHNGFRDRPVRPLRHPTPAHGRSPCIRSCLHRQGVCQVRYLRRPGGWTSSRAVCSRGLDGMVRNTSGPPFPDRPEPFVAVPGICSGAKRSGLIQSDTALATLHIVRTGCRIRSLQTGGSEVVGRMVRDAPACPAGMQRGSRGPVVNSRLTVQAPGL